MADLCAQPAELGAPANCCAAPPCSLIYQTRSGTFALCGIEEYTGASSPPKKYRTQTLSGIYKRCQYNNAANCSAGGFGAGSGMTINDWREYAGAFTYNRLTCATNNAQTEKTYPGGTSVACATQGALVATNTPVAPPITPLSGPTSMVVTQMPTRWQGQGGGSCNPVAKFFGTVTADLSDEDTEDDAIARAAVSWSACVPAGPTDCSAFKILRGVGVFSASYRQVQIKINVTGSTLGTVYEATIQLQRRVQGSGSAFVDWVQIFHEFVGTVDGNYVGPWLSVPCDSGYEVAAVGCANAVVP